MNLRRTSVFLLPIALLNACVTSRGLHPEAQPIDPATLHARRSAAAPPLSGAGWPARDWWATLGDPQLDRLIREALAANPDLASAQASARQAEAAVMAGAAARRPTLDASGGPTRASLPSGLVGSDLGGTPMDSARLSLSFSWTLDLWGGQRAAWEAALGQSRAADVDLQATRLQVSVDVARAYAQLGYAYAEQTVAHNERERADAARRLTQQRVEAGLDNRVQLRQADSEVAAAEAQIAAAEQDADTARIALAVLLGQGPDRGLDIAPPRALTPAQVAVPQNLPAELLGRRPDLVAARWRVEATQRQIDAARTRFLPNLNLGAYSGQLAQRGDDLFESAATYWALAPALSVPIFDGGRLRSELASRNADYDTAVARYDKTLVDAINQVADALARLRAVARQIDEQQHALDAAGEAWTLSQQRYEAGVGSYLEALTVRQQLLAAERSMAALRQQQVDVSIQLVQALGGGFTADSDTPVVAALPVEP